MNDIEHPKNVHLRVTQVHRMEKKIDQYSEKWGD